MKIKNSTRTIAIILVFAMLLTMGIASIPFAFVDNSSVVTQETNSESVLTETIKTEEVTDNIETTEKIEEPKEDLVAFTTDTSTFTKYEKQVVIETSKGNIVLELYPDIAPKTVDNFVNLINSEFYNGLTFHRVIDGFMIQGGDPLGNGTGGSETNIEGEFKGNNWTENNLSHTEGVVSMARATDPNSASSQFFICVADSTYLDGEYAAFGKVVEGLEIAKEIAKVEKDASDKPLEAIYMNKVYFK